MDEIENGKYLPVLYTISRWNLERGYQAKKQHFVPWLNKWVPAKSISSELFKIDKSVQDYYDRWYLNITVKSDRPKCPYCGKNLWFKELCHGYLKTCGSKECEYKRKSERSSQSYLLGNRRNPGPKYKINNNEGLTHIINKKVTKKER